MKKVLVGLSGGVDSAVSSKILINKGYDVTGCFLLLTESSDVNSEEAQQARAVADSLGIKLVFADYREHFRKNVTDYFAREYLSGKTPNPCVMCNPTTKFFSLLETADKEGADFIATGHYAKIGFSEEENIHFLSAAPSKKDQSYFLYRLKAEQLARVIFPLGEFENKEQVRDVGEKAGLSNSKKKDSQEICFIPDNNYAKFICNNFDFTPKPGDFLDMQGNKIGTHTGIINYTVGQRKGLGAFGEPKYVKKINAADNTVTLCRENERFATHFVADNIYINMKDTPERLTSFVKVRSTGTPEQADIVFSDNKMTIDFINPVLSPAPGQSAVIYDTTGRVLGGGVILK